jgi:hypothetical protein
MLIYECKEIHGDSIKICIVEIVCEDMDYIKPSRNKVQGHVFFKKAMNLKIPRKSEKSLVYLSDHS